MQCYRHVWRTPGFGIRSVCTTRRPTSTAQTCAHIQGPGCWQQITSHICRQQTEKWKRLQEICCTSYVVARGICEGSRFQAGGRRTAQNRSLLSHGGVLQAAQKETSWRGKSTKNEGKAKNKARSGITRRVIPRDPEPSARELASIKHTENKATKAYQEDGERAVETSRPATVQAGEAEEESEGPGSIKLRKWTRRFRVYTAKDGAGDQSRPGQQTTENPASDEGSQRVSIFTPKKGTPLDSAAKTSNRTSRLRKVYQLNHETPDFEAAVRQATNNPRDDKRSRRIRLKDDCGPSIRTFNAHIGWDFVRKHVVARPPGRRRLRRARTAAAKFRAIRRTIILRRRQRGRRLAVAKSRRRSGSSQPMLGKDRVLSREQLLEDVMDDITYAPPKYRPYVREVKSKDKLNGKGMR